MQGFRKFAYHGSFLQTFLSDSKMRKGTEKEDMVFRPDMQCGKAQDESCVGGGGPRTTGEMSLGKRRLYYMIESKFQDIVKAYISCF